MRRNRLSHPIRWAVLAALMASVALPPALHAKAGRCAADETDEEKAAWLRVYEELNAEWTDSARITRLSGPHRLTSLSVTVEIYGPADAAAAASLIAGELGTIDQKLRDVAATNRRAHRIDIVLYDAVEPVTLPDGSSYPAWFHGCEAGTYECGVAITREAWGLPPLQLRHVAAHEFFHAAQALVVPRLDNCKNAWWKEGTAEWFAHLVVPGSEWSRVIIEQRFNHRSNTTSLTHLSYEAQAFFFWAADRFGLTYAMELARLGDSVLKNPARLGSTIPPEDWQDFLETVLKGELRYPDGRPALPEPYLGEILAAPTWIDGPPLALKRARFELPPGDGELVVEGAQAYATLRDDDDWQRLSLTPAVTTSETECPGPDVVVVGGINLGDRGPFLHFEDAREVDACKCIEAAPREHCMIGVWKAVSTDAPSSYNSFSTFTGRASRWVGQDMGDAYFAFRPDGTFLQRIERETQSDFRHPTGHGTLKQTVTIINTARGRWAAPEAGRLKICKSEFSGEMTNRMGVGPDMRTTGPTPIPYDPVAEELGFDYTYECSGNRARVTQLLGGAPFISWQAQRASGSRLPPPSSAAPSRPPP